MAARVRKPAGNASAMVRVRRRVVGWRRNEGGRKGVIGGEEIRGGGRVVGGKRVADCMTLTFGKVRCCVR